jgi:hypothetical protein
MKNPAKLNWLLSGDTGASSESIMRVMEGVPGACYTPMDLWDVGRCVRLLDRIPEYRERLAEMGKASKYWAALLPHWGELEQFYRDQKHSECIALISKLINGVQHG